MKNERGYIFFSTLIVLTIVLVVIVNSVVLFITEKNFADKTESIYSIDHLLLLAKNDTTKMLMEEESADDGVLLYENGRVAYEIIQVDSELVRVSFTAFNHKGGMGQGYFIYNISNHKMTKWSEI